MKNKCEKGSVEDEAGRRFHGRFGELGFLGGGRALSNHFQTSDFAMLITISTSCVVAARGGKRGFCDVIVILYLEDKKKEGELVV